MFYYIYKFFYPYVSFLRLFKYITIRSFCAAGTAFFICILFAPWVIRKLKMMSFKQCEKREYVEELYKLHHKKEGTPTMGGILIIVAVVSSSLLWVKLEEAMVWYVIATMLFMGAVGFIDDFSKVSKRNPKGISARSKLLFEAGWAILIFFALNFSPEISSRLRELYLPFLKTPVIKDMGIILSLLFFTLVITGSTNAVNLTDGLDGLAIGCSSSCAIAFLVFSYMAGNKIFADYLLIPYVDGAGELAVVCGALLGASLGFLWYNCHPAEVFMGDTGSLAIGGLIGIIACLIKQEVVLCIVGGIFVIEAFSVILQVLSFKLTGKRIFAMSPLHHHFELKNWSETQVVIRFWILSIIFAILGIMTMKIR